jgi:transposase
MSAQRGQSELRMICPKCGEAIGDKWRREALLESLRAHGWDRKAAAKDCCLSLRTVRLWVAKLRADGHVIDVSEHRRKHEPKK